MTNFPPSVDLFTARLLFLWAFGVRNITLDIDDCLVDTNGVSEKIAARYGETLNYSDFNYINRCSPACAEEISKFLFVGDASCDHKLVPLTSTNIPRNIKELSTILNIHYVTTRAPEKYEPTLRYFEHKDIHVPRNNLIALGAGADKIDVILKLKSLFHMDDSATTIQKCMEYNVNFCMMSNPKTGYNIPMREKVGKRWVGSFDEFWQRKFEFLPMINQKGILK
ncbi:hypothetical protein FACS189421_02570 [Bacteroidia bacterium]|nr:hypothetical protein FACS189421_02570 [Bacteroidia bacterium]